MSNINSYASNVESWSCLIQRNWTSPDQFDYFLFLSCQMHQNWSKKLTTKNKKGIICTASIHVTNAWIRTRRVWCTEAPFKHITLPIDTHFSVHVNCNISCCSRLITLNVWCKGSVNHFRLINSIICYQLYLYLVLILLQPVVLCLW